MVMVLWMTVVGPCTDYWDQHSANVLGKPDASSIQEASRRGTGLCCLVGTDAGEPSLLNKLAESR